MGTSPDEEGFSLVAEVLHLFTLGCTRRATYRRQTRATLQASHAARTLNLPNLAKLPHRTFAYSPFSQTSLLALPRTASNTVMFPLAMRTAVFQAILIHAASLILDNHLRGNTFDKMMENEVFMTMWNAVDILAFKVTNNATHANGPGPLTLDAGNTTNTTLSLNQTIASNGGWQNLNPQPPFYCQRLPRELVVHMVIFALQYWWFVGLERILPARPRSKEVPRQRENKVELSEDREEEVVEKWIAQGKVQRASLSWCNTFLKWVLVMTVGELLLHTVAHVVREAISLSSPRSILAGLKSHLIYNLVSTYLSPNPLAVFVAFAVVPAHKRLVFVVGADLVWMLFYHTLVRALAVRAIKTDFAQRYMRNVTAFVENIEAGKEKVPKMPSYLKYDEL